MASPLLRADTPLDRLAAVRILQPTDIITGTQALVVGKIQPQHVGVVTQITLFIYAKTPGPLTTAQWHEVASVNNPAVDDGSFFRLTFDSSQFSSPQEVLLKVRSILQQREGRSGWTV